MASSPHVFVFKIRDMFRIEGRKETSRAHRDLDIRLVVCVYVLYDIFTILQHIMYTVFVNESQVNTFTFNMDITRYTGLE